MNDMPRPEYPRPNLVREHWVNLNGVWEFSFDAPVFDQKILVPFCYQSQKSGIGDETEHGTVWYRRSLSLKETDFAGKRVLLHFDAVDYECRIYLNQQLAGTHQGGNNAFTVDITKWVQDGENELTVEVNDSYRQSQPRGKQRWKDHSFGCWYTPVTGIWKTVWLEYVGETYIEKVHFTPDIDKNQAVAELFLNGTESAEVTVQAYLSTDGEKKLSAECTAFCRCGYGKAVLDFPDLDVRTGEELLWSPEHPNLIDVDVTVRRDNTVVDQVSTYFGMRKIQVMDGQVYLNNMPLFQRLILDQGYWKESLLTPPSDEAIRQDIELTLKMGFNGARKHQKIEDARYYYWADRMGLLLWAELPSCYEFNTEAIGRSMQEMKEAVDSYYNSPSIIFWTPLNESWGINKVLCDPQQQDYVRAMYYYLKSLDPTRLVSSNDGWEQVCENDICAIHDYHLFPSNVDKYADMGKILDTVAQVRKLYAEGNAYQGEPILLTEYGGIAFEDQCEGENWGYFGAVRSEEEFFDRLAPVTRYLFDSGNFQGFCYTQLTDVQQEINGLLTEDRKPKVSIEWLRQVFGGNL